MANQIETNLFEEVLTDEEMQAICGGSNYAYTKADLKTYLYLTNAGSLFDGSITTAQIDAAVGN